MLMLMLLLIRIIVRQPGSRNDPALREIGLCLKFLSNL